MKRRKNIISFILVIALVSSMAFGIDFRAFAATSQTVYFDNSVSKWSNVYAYVWGDGQSTQTIKGTKTNTNIYQLTIPKGYKKILFKNTAGTSNWDKQTQDTTIPTDGKNCYKANSSSNKSSGTWSSYTLPTVTPVATPTAPANNNTLKRQVKVLVLEINPTLKHPTGGKFGNGKSTITTDKYLGFDASESISFLKENLEEVSHGNVELDIIERIYIDEFPKYTNGASLTQKDVFDIYPIQSNGYGNWWQGLSTEKFKKFSEHLTFDYDSLIDDYNLVKRKNNGEFDMVWVFGNDPIALYEGTMVGKKTFFINGGRYTRNCDNFPILTMTYSRKDGSLEDVGHMVECILTNVFQSGEVYSTEIDGTDLSKLTTWEKFVLCEGNAKKGTTVYGLGNVHYSPNSKTDYDWGNQTPVKSYWKDFENGNLKNIGSTVSTFTAKTAYQSNQYNTCNDDTISHHRWWFSCMPHTEGRDENGFSNNWWDYIFTPDYVDTISFVEGNGQQELTMSTGESKQLSLLLNYYSGNQKKIGLKESEAIVSLDSSGVLTYENGKITAKKSGTATISAKYDGRVAKLKVNVSKPSSNILTVYYGGQNWSKAYIHYKTENGNWTSVPGYQMTSTSEVSGYNWKYTIDLSKDNSKYATVCFNNGNGNWDSKNGSNYQISAGTYGVKNGNIFDLGSSSTTPTPATPTPKPTYQSYVAVDFDNSIHKWESVYAYVWNNTEDSKVFSATTVSDHHVLFNITGSYKYILFKNTEAGWDKQTADLVMPAYTSSADDKCFKPYSAANKSGGTWGKSSALNGKKIILPSVSADKNTITLGDTVNFTMTAQYENGSYHNGRHLTFTYEDGTEDTVYSYDTSSVFGKVSGYTYNYSWKPSKTGKVKVTYSVSQYQDHTETSQPIILNVKAAGNTVKIYYKNSSWSKAYVHYNVNGTWTNVPGVKMETSDRSGYTWMYSIDLGNTTSATLCFNNGNGSWDSKNGSNYTVGTGIYGISGNNTVKLN